MKTKSFCVFAVSLLVMCTAAFAQTPAEIDSHIATAKAAAGLDFRGTFVNLCLPGAAPGGVRGGAGRGAPNTPGTRGPAGAPATPATPDRAGWYASPYQ